MLRWLALRALRNEVRWGVRKPLFWIMAILLVISFAPLAFLPPERAPPRETYYATFDEAWVAVVVNQMMIAVVCGTFGPMATIVRRPVIDIVYPAPLDRGAYLRARVRRALVGVLAGVPGVGLLASPLAADILGIPAWLFAIRFAAAFLPAAGFWLALGILGAYASSKVSERVQNAAVVLGLLLLFAGLPSVLTLNLAAIGGDPLIVLLAGLSIVPTDVMLGIPLNPAEALVLILSWVAFLGMAATALGWPYEVYEDSGTHGVPAPGGFSRERPARPGFLHDLSLRFRIRYIDLGSGGAALLGRNLTVSLRGPNLAIQAMMVGMLVFIAFPFAFTSGSFWFRFSVPVLMAGLLAGMMGAIRNVVSLEGVHGNLVRLLPLAGADVYLASIAPALLSNVVWASVVVIAVAIAGATPVLILLGFLTIISVGAWTNSWSFFVSTLLPSGPTSAEAVEPAATGWAFLMMVSIFLVMLELTPLILVFRAGLVATLLGTVTGVNLALAAVSGGAGIAVLRHPPNR